ncbi:Sensor histidine kinase YpdA [compost metagenome]
MYWDIDDAAAGFLLPKVILQPLVENSILHGIKHMGNEGELYISVKMNGGLVEISVGDNGFKPVDYERIRMILEDSIPNTSYGIRNVDKRIKLHFGEAYGLAYAPRAGGGTCAVLVVPATGGDTTSGVKGE